MRDLCPEKLHFPERVYWWEIPLAEYSGFFAHCARCHTDYSLPKYMKGMKGEGIVGFDSVEITEIVGGIESMIDE